MAHDWDSGKGKLFLDNPFISRTPSATGIDMKGTLKALYYCCLFQGISFRKVCRAFLLVFVNFRFGLVFMIDSFSVSKLRKTW